MGPVVKNQLILFLCFVQKFFVVTPHWRSTPGFPSNQALIKFKRESLECPHVTKVNDLYYVTDVREDNSEIHLLTNPFLGDLAWVTRMQKVYESPNMYREIKSPKLYEVNAKRFINFIMTDYNTGSVGICTMSAKNSKAPLSLSDATVCLEIGVGDTFHSISGSVVLNHHRGLYLIWNGKKSSSDKFETYISSMTSPIKVTGPAVLLDALPGNCTDSTCKVSDLSLIYEGNKAFLVLRFANKLSFMKVDFDDDPLDPLKWSKSGLTKLLSTQSDLVSIEQASFTKSMDDKETWMLYQIEYYHQDKTIKLAKVEWNRETDYPIISVDISKDTKNLPRPSGEAEMFTNPILDGTNTDPSVLLSDGEYFLTLSQNDYKEIHVLKSNTLANFRNAERKVIYSAPQNCKDIWAGEMHEIQGQLYMYFSMQNETSSHRLYVMKADDPKNPMGTWGNAAILLQGHPNLRHGTILQHNNRLYLVFVSGDWFAKKLVLRIYITPMNSPTEVTTNGPVVLLKAPTEQWECQGLCINENPYFLYVKNVAYMVFSAGANIHYGQCLAYMSIQSGRDPMNVTNWTPALKPSFTSNAKEGVQSVGMATFTTSPDKEEIWMVYDGTEKANGERSLRLEKIQVDEKTGALLFPEAHGFRHPQLVPSRIRATKQSTTVANAELSMAHFNKTHPASTNAQIPVNNLSESSSSGSYYWFGLLCVIVIAVVAVVLVIRYAKRNQMGSGFAQMVDDLL